MPREHGSWGLLLYPFVSAAILAQRWTPLLLPALVAALATFLSRESLLILLGQRRVWREPRPDPRRPA